MNFKKLILGIGIFIVFALAFHQGLETFYPTPQWDAFCTNHAGPAFVKDTNSCIVVPELNKKAEQCAQARGQFVYEYSDAGCPTSGFCDDCNINYEKALDVHSNRVFIISIITGIVVFVAGLILLSTEPVGSALMGGGVWSVFYGVIVNWRNFTQSWRFLLLFILLVVLIWIALRLNSKKKFFGKKINWN